jgi:hypothetical protein
MSTTFARALEVVTPATRCVRLTWDEQLEVGRARNAALLWAEGTLGRRERGYDLTFMQVSAHVRKAEADALAAILARRHEEGRP